jgi:hypothetical protein
MSEPSPLITKAEKTAGKHGAVRAHEIGRFAV